MDIIAIMPIIDILPYLSLISKQNIYLYACFAATDNIFIFSIYKVPYENSTVTHTEKATKHFFTGMRLLTLTILPPHSDPPRRSCVYNFLRL